MVTPPPPPRARRWQAHALTAIFTATHAQQCMTEGVHASPSPAGADVVGRATALQQLASEPRTAHLQATARKELLHTLVHSDSEELLMLAPCVTQPLRHSHGHGHGQEEEEMWVAVRRRATQDVVYRSLQSVGQRWDPPCASFVDALHRRRRADERAWTQSVVSVYDDRVGGYVAIASTQVAKEESESPALALVRDGISLKLSAPTEQEEKFAYAVDDAFDAHASRVSRVPRMDMYDGGGGVENGITNNGLLSTNAFAFESLLDDIKAVASRHEWPLVAPSLVAELLASHAELDRQLRDAAPVTAGDDDPLGLHAEQEREEDQTDAGHHHHHHHKDTEADDEEDAEEPEHTREEVLRRVMARERALLARLPWHVPHVATWTSSPSSFTADDWALLRHKTRRHACRDVAGQWLLLSDAVLRATRNASQSLNCVRRALLWHPGQAEALFRASALLHEHAGDPDASCQVLGHVLERVDPLAFRGGVLRDAVMTRFAHCSLALRVAYWWGQSRGLRILVTLSVALSVLHGALIVVLCCHDKLLRRRLVVVARGKGRAG